MGTAPGPSVARGRLLSLDVVRGVALAGIALVNVPSLLHRQGWVGEEYPVPLNPVRGVLDLVVQERFFPIFSLLFGIGFGLTWRSAQRAPRPRVVMLRRLLFLLALGAAHQVLSPGEALLFYALFGLVLALPLTWAPRPVALGLGLLLLLVSIPSRGRSCSSPPSSPSASPSPGTTSPAGQRTTPGSVGGWSRSPCLSASR